MSSSPFHRLSLPFAGPFKVDVLLLNAQAPTACKCRQSSVPEQKYVHANFKIALILTSPYIQVAECSFRRQLPHGSGFFPILSQCLVV